MNPAPSRFRRAVAGRLEVGLDGSVSAALARLWAYVADPQRPVCLPPSARVVGVGGATLGGSCKTPVVLELARELCSRGDPVAVVASCYPVHVAGARRVLTTDLVTRVGDEALMLARSLGASVPVIVGSDRNAALRLAASLAPTVIVDALLQTRPKRLAGSILVLDARAPWGAARCPPAGDLRARPARLLEACDVVLMVAEAADRERASAFAGAVEKPALLCISELAGARRPDGSLALPSTLSTLPLGLVLAVARPGRVVDALARAGIRLEAVHLCADHAVPAEPPGRAPSVAAWLTTAKCATKLGERWGGKPVWVLEQRLALPAPVLDWATARASLS